MMQDIIEVGHRAKLSSASPNPPQLIKEGYFFVFFSIAPSSKFFCRRP